jgi:cell division protein FtsI/penicillin-binding protein 2
MTTMVSKFAHSRRTTPTKTTHTSGRGKLVTLALYLGLLVILGRLFQWQIIQGTLLKAAAQDQYQHVITEQGKRGSIFTSDGSLLVGNDVRYQLVGYPHLSDRPVSETIALISPLLLEETRQYREATETAQREELENNLKQTIQTRMEKPDAKWVPLFPSISKSTMEQLQAFNLSFLDYEPQAARLYPEASMAAHVVGFLGKTDLNEPIGYFGLEGALNKELAAKTKKTLLSTDALGFSLFGQQSKPTETHGRDIVLTIRRDLQNITETMLKKGMERYGASAGEIIIMEPSTGKILAMASQPTYDPRDPQSYDQILYKNPSLSELFEPGSIFKTLTVSAGIDGGVITPDTECPNCEGPRVIGKYTIKTWNEEYHPHITMKDALAKSDNIAMIHIVEQLGEDKFKEYLHNFGIGEPLGVDLQEDQQTPFPDKWGPVELATRSFGQGINVNSLQMVRAVSTIANKGVMMQSRIVDKVIEPSGKEIAVEPKQVRRVLSSEAAQQVAEMMVHSAKSGEAQWTYSKTHSVAAKTGTSQIPKKEGGGYEDDATIATFIGFAPPSNPRFVMLVKLVRPQSSPWAAETAAPLWYQTAEKVFLLLNIPADN